MHGMAAGTAAAGLFPTGCLRTDKFAFSKLGCRAPNRSPGPDPKYAGTAAPAPGRLAPRAYRTLPYGVSCVARPCNRRESPKLPLCNREPRFFLRKYVKIAYHFIDRRRETIQGSVTRATRTRAGLSSRNRSSLCGGCSSQLHHTVPYLSGNRIANPLALALALAQRRAFS